MKLTTRGDVMFRRAMVVLIAFIASCDRQDADPPKPANHEVWVERVKLANGEVLVVQREKRHGNGEMGSSGGPLTYARLEFDYRGSHYKWESENVAPGLLEFDEKWRPVIAGSIVYEWAWRQRGSPCDRGVVQYWEDGVWKQIPSWELPVSNRLNLAADKERGERGLSASEDIRSPSPVYLFHVFEKACRPKEIGNVQ